MTSALIAADNIEPGDRIHFFMGEISTVTEVRQWGSTIAVSDDHGNNHRWSEHQFIRVTKKNTHNKKTGA